MDVVVMSWFCCTIGRSSSVRKEGSIEQRENDVVIGHALAMTSVETQLIRDSRFPTFYYSLYVLDPGTSLPGAGDSLEKPSSQVHLSTFYFLYFTFHISLLPSSISPRKMALQ